VNSAGEPRPEPRAPLPLRQAAEEVAARLAAAGHEALFAGGCVRDELMGLEPKDYDIATSATPAQILEVFPRARDVGEAFGVMLVRHGGRQFEVATFRKDGPYLDGRRPSEVHFSSRDEDAARRDFTINGMFRDPATGELFGCREGERDIRDRLVRAIGDAHARIAEDRLRMLRAVRFAARFGFRIEDGTAAAIREHAPELRAVSPERVGDEMRRMLGHAARAAAARLVEELGLDHAVFGAARGAGAGRNPRLDALAPEAEWTTALAAWIVDRASGGSGGFVTVSQEWRASQCAAVRVRLVLSNRETEAVEAALSQRERIAEEFDQAPHAAKARLVAERGFDDALDILVGDRAADATRWRSEADRILPARRLPTPLVDGAALIAAGFRPGPAFKSLLDLALDAQLEGRIATPEEGIALVRDATAGR